MVFDNCFKRVISLSQRVFVQTLTICFVSSIAVTAYGQTELNASSALHSKVQKVINADSKRITRIYKDIHQNPELAFMEIRTAKIVVKELESLGFEVTSGIGKTGVLAILRNGDGPAVLYRADMDANAVEETTGVPYASKVKVSLENGKEVPVAHMCGHDAHVSWMLGMAHAMVKLKDQWSGTLMLVGQPAEETIAGAKAMVKDGLYTRFGMPKPDYMLVLHTAPVPVGTVIAASGPISSGSDSLDVTFFGVGGHGSMPQHTKDPVVMAASAVVQYQSIVSRSIDTQQAAVLTVGSIQAGHANNVIPDSALLKLNLRWFSDSVREQLLSGIKNINQAVAIANGLPAEKMPIIKMKGNTSPVINDAALTTRIASRLKSTVKKSHIIEQAPRAMASEDAHLLLGDHTDVPLAYLAVGIASPKAFADNGYKPPYFPHNGDYKVELEALSLGSRIATISVLELLAH